MSTTTTTTRRTVPPPRGALIIFEGLDRSGKSTQVDRLYQTLIDKGNKVKKIGFPDRTSPTGVLINAYLTQKDSELSDEAIHLLFSANRWEKVKEIKQSLKEGVTILCDRYAFSGICFSFIKGLNWEWCKSPDVGLPLPDLILFLSISPETARLRSGFGQERYETQEIQNEVRKVFERLKTQEFSDSDGSIWKEISAEGDITEVQERIRKQVEELFESEKFLTTSQEIGKLWVD